MNKTAISNFSKLRISIFYLPCLLGTSIFISLYCLDALSHHGLINLQKPYFLSLNKQLSQFPAALHNCTQLGDAMIILSFLTLLIIYAPKVWETIISASIISAVFTLILKQLFRIPRPAAYIQEEFTIIGEKLSGHNSFPSGHSITVFTVFTVLLFAFMPKRIEHKIFCCCSFLLLGFTLAMTRIGVGAHYPLDILVGAIVGYTAGISGIIINERYNLYAWVTNRKFYPLLIITFLVCIIVLVFKIVQTNLPVFYIALTSLLSSIIIIIKLYVQK